MKIATSPFVCRGAAVFMPEKMGNLQGVSSAPIRRECHGLDAIFSKKDVNAAT